MQNFIENNQENDFSLHTLKLKPDYDGKVIATLLCSLKNKNKQKCILYLHGFVDYFFHPHVCEKFHENNFDFYALDLRKYGRSLRPHQKPNYCEDISEYFEEITQAITIIKAKGNQDIYLLGHSTGGLIAAYYMNIGKQRNAIKGLILNSPFLAMPFPHRLSAGLYFSVHVLSKLFPNGKINGLPSAYGKSLHIDHDGSWEYNLAWKPLKGFPTYFKWAKAVMKAQYYLKKQSAITIPVLVLHASDSLKKKKVCPKAFHSDIVLNIKDIKRIAPYLGKHVKLTAIPNGIHDLFLSNPSVRAKAFDEMFEWLKQF